jgi:hypothetical protein
MGVEKFDDLGQAVKKAEEIGGIVVKYTIQKNLIGKYVLRINTYDVYDGLTRNIFVRTENGIRMRDIVVENENTYYEDVEDTDFEIEFECGSFLEVKKKLEKIIEKIMKNREKIRLTKKEHGYIVF